jgi:hypothetical protein
MPGLEAARRRGALSLTVLCGTALLVLNLLPLPQCGALLGLPTLCPFKLLTGLPCPGCGMTRALIYCAHGDWHTALAFHPLGPLVFGALWLAFIIGVLRPFVPRRFAIAQSIFLPAGFSFIIALLAVWFWRLTHLATLPANF